MYEVEYADGYKTAARVITNDDIPEADDEFDPELFDNYVNMEISIDRNDDRPEYETPPCQPYTTPARTYRKR